MAVISQACNYCHGQVHLETWAPWTDFSSLYMKQEKNPSLLRLLFYKPECAEFTCVTHVTPHFNWVDPLQHEVTKSIHGSGARSSQ